MANPASEEYQYFLPAFVGHPFGAKSTESLRDAIQLVCNSVNGSQTEPERFLWEPRFLSKTDHTDLQNLLRVISEEIRQSALAVFDISDSSRMNVFLELGMAIGQNRAIALLMRKPWHPPADLRGIRGIEYTDEVDLQIQLRDFLMMRLSELRRSPPKGQTEINHKMQIDGTWAHRLQTADKSIYFFAGDVSWTHRYADILRSAHQRGVTLRACCCEPDEDETVKWENIENLKALGCRVKLLPRHIDPRVRGFVVDAQEMNQNTEALIVEKRTRNGGRTDYTRTGVTLGESEFIYRGRVFRFNEESRIVGALCRLFDSTWHDTTIKSFWPREHLTCQSCNWNEPNGGSYRVLFAKCHTIAKLQVSGKRSCLLT